MLLRYANVMCCLKHIVLPEQYKQDENLRSSLTSKWVACRVVPHKHTKGISPWNKYVQLITACINIIVAFQSSPAVFPTIHLCCQCLLM